MRHLTLAELIDIALRLICAPDDSPWPRVLDPERSIAALMRGCGDGGSNVVDEAVYRIFDVVEGLLEFQPGHASTPEELAAEAARRLAGNFGFEISKRDAAILAEQALTETGGYEQQTELIRSVLLRARFTAVPVKTPPLVSLTVFSSRDTHTGHEDEAARALRSRIEARLSDLGARVVSTPTGPTISGGVLADRDASVETPGLGTGAYAAHCAALYGSQFLLSFDFSCADGTVMDRAVAESVGMPFFVVRKAGPPRPHEDPQAASMSIDFEDGDSIEETVHSSVAAILRFAPRIRDFAAWQDAVELQHAAKLTYLRAAWSAIQGPGRRLVAERSRVSESRIEVALASATAWESLASRKRTAIDLELGAPREHHGSHFGLGATERRFLSEACDLLDLSRQRTIAVVGWVVNKKVASRNRFRIDDLRGAIEVVNSMPD